MRYPAGKTLSLALLVLTSRAAVSQWVQQPFPTNEYLWRVGFVDTSTGWILGHQQVYKTSNGGATWQAQDSTYGATFALCTLNRNVVFYAGFDGFRSHGIRRTTNGGSTWQTVDSDTSFYCTDIKFTSAQVGYAVGGTYYPAPVVPILRKTTDGGGTWSTLPSVFPQARDELEAISFIDTLRGWVVSYDGVVFRTTDGGNSWSYQDSVGYRVPGVMSWLPTRDVQFMNESVGWVGGGISGDNFVAKTTNGGATWSYATPGGTSIRRIVMLTPLVGWIVGPTIGNYICKTTDGGATWSSQQLIPLTFSGFEWISIIDQQIGWAVGISGRVFKTTNGGVVFVEEATNNPNDFHLFQNFPNPFNPTTTIQFTIPVRTYGRTSLRVYDLLGREVATLVNEVKSPGEYRTTWDASGVASGVYFYRLTAGGFVQTKRLVLLQ
ncbi:MAG: hypothetical protein HW412_2224 [Bacteroidetes bacterium]|nr:hypothetical protein [Bacteroidota bacterium]